MVQLIPLDCLTNFDLPMIKAITLLKSSAAKLLFVLLLLLTLHIPVEVSAQVKGTVVELYYISDNNDATHVVNGQSLPVGSKTYRVYVTLEQGSKIRKIYGDVNHPLIFSSTADFYNNTDRPSATFGYLINKNWFYDNPTLALDSWLSLGLATKTQLGVVKAEDTDGDVLSGANNSGGSAAILGGLLTNYDASAFVPLTTADGLIPSTLSLSQWLDNGMKDLAGDDTTVFGSINTGNEFNSTTAFLQQVSGVGSATASGNVLVAQLTTTGELSFEINLEVEVPTVSGSQIVKYVANAANLQSDEVLAAALKYPAVCGCTDAHYIEYSAAYTCSSSDSCKHLVRLGCKDSAACNFDPDANYDVPQMCCYPGRCNDRDLAVVCPSVSGGLRIGDVYPNPATDKVHVKGQAAEAGPLTVGIYNNYGKLISEKVLDVEAGSFDQTISLDGVGKGLFCIRISSGEVNRTSMILKY